MTSSYLKIRELEQKAMKFAVSIINKEKFTPPELADTIKLVFKERHGFGSSACIENLNLMFARIEKEAIAMIDRGMRFTFELLHILKSCKWCVAYTVLRNILYRQGDSSLAVDLDFGVEDFVSLGEFQNLEENDRGTTFLLKLLYMQRRCGVIDIFAEGSEIGSGTARIMINYAEKYNWLRMQKYIARNALLTGSLFAFRYSMSQNDVVYTCRYKNEDVSQRTIDLLKRAWGCTLYALSAWEENDKQLPIYLLVEIADSWIPSQLHSLLDKHFPAAERVARIQALRDSRQRVLKRREQYYLACQKAQEEFMRQPPKRRCLGTSAHDFDDFL